MTTDSNDIDITSPLRIEPSRSSIVSLASPPRVMEIEHRGFAHGSALELNLGRLSRIHILNDQEPVPEANVIPVEQRNIERRARHYLGGQVLHGNVGNKRHFPRVRDHVVEGTECEL